MTSEATDRKTFITIRGLSKSFNGTVIYTNSSISTCRKENSSSIFGPNGCGKSTLINMISRTHADGCRHVFDSQTISGDAAFIRFPKLPGRTLFRGFVRSITFHYHLKLMGLSRRERTSGSNSLL